MWQGSDTLEVSLHQGSTWHMANIMHTTCYLNTQETTHVLLYVGGGREVTHVEVSLDQGSTWRLTKITHGASDHVTDNNKHFCWYLWEVEFKYEELAAASEIRCRACDSAMNTQPER